MRDRVRDRREGSRGMKKKCKPGWKIRGKRKEGRTEQRTERLWRMGGSLS